MAENIPKATLVEQKICEACPDEATTFVSGIGEIGQGGYFCTPCAEIMERSKQPIDLKAEAVDAAMVWADGE